MKNGAWRSSRHLIYGLFGALVSLPETVRADAAGEFVSYYQQAYVQGQDLVPASPTPLDTSSITTRLDLQSVSPKAALAAARFSLRMERSLNSQAFRVAFRPSHSNIRVSEPPVP